MGEKNSEIGQFFDKILLNSQRTDRKIVGEEGEFVKAEMAKDNKGAWVNHFVEQYLKKEELDETPEEFNITMNDIMKEISKREIRKIFGQ